MTKRLDKLTVSIPEGLKRKAKAKAALEGKSLSAVVTELLREWVGTEFNGGSMGKD